MHCEVLFSSNRLCAKHAGVRETPGLVTKLRGILFVTSRWDCQTISERRGKDGSELTRKLILKGWTGIAEALGLKAKLIEQARLVRDYTSHENETSYVDTIMITCMG